jgi:cell division initiation protein
MRITPLEIRQKSFEKKMRGYDKDAVDAFVLSLSHEWERRLDESKHIKEQLETSQHDVRKLREVEESLFKTLKTAEDTGSNLIDQATKSAELTIKEAQMNAEAMLAEARSQVRDMLDQADAHVKEVLGGLDEEARKIEADLRILENHRDAVLRELTMVSNDTLARVANFSTARFDVSIPKKEILKPIPPIIPILVSTSEEDEGEMGREGEIIEIAHVPIVEEITEDSISNTLEEDVRNQISFEVNTNFEEVKPIVQEVSGEEVLPIRTKEKKQKQGGSFFDHLD